MTVFLLIMVLLAVALVLLFQIMILMVARQLLDILDANGEVLAQIYTQQLQGGVNDNH